ncbi:DgyrCDS12874 [Dimorphilus gyrociliatus]|uniref:DgyrCDS12874 n=1 Tax=Dimorphilus gyrociliatus TaxID=2664684 RepID=A0A7I8W911_9ANNE|nr:DgyrCDS12874 [Dimorphilus gyrociliatus]
MQLLKHLQRYSDIDFLVEPTRIIGKEAVMLVDPDQLILIDSKFPISTGKARILNGNVEKDLEDMWKRLDQKKVFNINDYNTLEDINSELDRYAANCKEGVTCEIEEFGNSVEGRPLRMLKITKPGPDRKVLVFDSTIHSREWLAPATLLKVLDLIHKQEENDAIELLNKYDFYFSIILNPDGYVYTWETERFWRKTRSINPNSICNGVDLDRNFDIKWGTVGASTNPCTDEFCGSAKASEPETKAIQDLSLRIGHKVLAWNTMHTAAQTILFAWSVLEDGVCKMADDHDDLSRVADAYADAIENTYGTVWRRGNSCLLTYPTSGTQNDYLRAQAGIKWVYTPGLRGPGFNPGSNAIEPSFREYWNGVKAMIKAIEDTKQ